MTDRENVMTSSGTAKGSDRVAREFDALTSDVSGLLSNEDPKDLALLLFKLAQERQHTNALLEKLSDQYDQVMFLLKTQIPSAASLDHAKPTDWIRPPQPPLESEPPVRSRSIVKVLPDQDAFILKMIETNGQVSAADVMSELGYKGKNAASQRLNMLVREGHLRKIQAGRNVVFMARIP